MEEKCFGPGCTKPTEYSCNCVNPRVLLCESHLAWHITSRNKTEHSTKRLDLSKSNGNKDCLLCFRKTSKYLCLCRDSGVKLCNDCFDLHSLQNPGRHIKEPIEASEFIKEERDIMLYVERRDQIESILRIIKENTLDIQNKEELFRILNTKIIEKLKK